MVGPSGCGKSTLLDVLAGLARRPAARSCSRASASTARVPDGVGVVFQEDASFPWLTVSDNIAFGLRRAGVDERRDRAARRPCAVASWGCVGFAKAYPAQLSGGMRQRVCIARTLVMRPRLMLLDEPFGALDQQTRLLMGDELLKLWRETGATVLLITHALDEAAMLSDRIGVMSARPGRVHRGGANRLAARARQHASSPTTPSAQITARLWSVLRAESLKSLARASAARHEAVQPRRLDPAARGRRLLAALELLCRTGLRSTRVSVIAPYADGCRAPGNCSPPARTRSRHPADAVAMSRSRCVLSVVGGLCPRRLLYPACRGCAARPIRCWPAITRCRSSSSIRCSSCCSVWTAGRLVAIGFMFAVVAMVMSTLQRLRAHAARAAPHRARPCACRPRRRWSHVMLPSCAPYLFTGIKLAIAYAFIGVIAGEFVLSGAGFGFEIAYAYNNFDNATMYGLMVLLLGFVGVLNMVLYSWERRMYLRRGGR